MGWDSIKETIGKYAPVAGSLIGGPAGGAVGALISSVLGVDNTPEAIEQAVKSDPQAALKLKQFDHEYRTKLAEISFLTLKVELQDKQNARKEHKDHWMPATITVLLSLMVIGIYASLILAEIPPRMTDVVYLLVGQVVGAFMTAVAYWLGTSRSSKDKDNSINKAFSKGQP